MSHYCAFADVLKGELYMEEIAKWFVDADFGIFIHHGLYSIPAYSLNKRPKNHKNDCFKYNLYAEWYQNSLRIEGSPTQKFHRETYGETFAYEDFKEEFDKSIYAINVDEWAELFFRAGAKYIVLVSKHHDGFCLWDTNVVNPHNKNYHLDRDFVGDMATAVRKKGMYFGIYYSSLLDWTFVKEPIVKRFDIRGKVDYSAEYKEYVYQQWKELIDRYKPDILWSDIGYPDDNERLISLFKYYKTIVPNGLINDRWTCFPKWLIGNESFLQNLFSGYCLRKSNLKLNQYFDYCTTEYRELQVTPSHYWEMCRGIDLSFGYSKQSLPSNHLTAAKVEEIVKRVKPLNGRLLLNVGCMGNGELPPLQKSVLEELAKNKTTC